jgi:hypothetical protein
LVSLYIESSEAELVNGSQYPTEICSNFMCMGYGSCTKCVYNNDVLYEMDWLSYLLHLSAWSPREAQHTWAQYLLRAGLYQKDSNRACSFASSLPFLFMPLHPI